MSLVCRLSTHAVLYFSIIEIMIQTVRHKKSSTATILVIKINLKTAIITMPALESLQRLD